MNKLDELTLDDVLQATHQSTLHVSDKHLIEISKTEKYPLAVLYWFSLKPEDRANANETTSLATVCKLIREKVNKGITNDEIIHRLKVTNQKYYDWFKLRAPIDDYSLKHFAHLFQIPSIDLLNSKNYQINQWLSHKHDTKVETPLKKKATDTTKSTNKRSNSSVLIENLKRYVKQHHEYVNVTDLLHNSVMNTSSAYRNDHPDLKYAKRIAHYLDMNLQYLLTKEHQKSYQNQLYANVKHYANQNKITFNEFERRSHLPFGIIIKMPRSKYLNGLVNLAQMLDVSVDDLVAEPLKTELKPTYQEHKAPKYASIEVGQLGIQLDNPSKRVTSNNVPDKESDWNTKINGLPDDKQQLLNNLINYWKA